MHTFELQQSIKRFLDEKKNFQTFLAAVSAIAQTGDSIDIYLKGLAKGGSELNDFAGKIHVHLSLTNRTLSPINQRSFFRELEHFQRCLAELQPSHSERSALIVELSFNVDVFAQNYDRFLSSPSGEHALPLVRAAVNLKVNVNALFGWLQFFEQYVENNEVLNKSEASLALWLPAHLDITRFANKLLALQQLYSELCMLLSLSQSDYPLKISKIESGSLWAKIFGESRVIGMMVSFIESTASWIYRNRTNEGQLASVPRKVEAIDELLGLTKRLNDAGIDTSSMKSHIEKSAVSIAKELAEILDGQASISVNDRTISIHTEFNKALFEQTTPRALPLSVDFGDVPIEQVTPQSFQIPETPQVEHRQSLPPPKKE